jgi:N-acetylmuramoyl-L-alanine amidase
MKNNLFRYGVALLISTCLIGWVTGPPTVSAAGEQTSFDIRTTAATAEEKVYFDITIEGANLDQLYGYDLTIEVPNGVTFVKEKAVDYLPGGLPAPYQEGNTVRFGSTKTGHAAGENGTMTLSKLTLQADIPGIVKIKLVKVKSMKNLDTGLHSTVHEVNKTVSVLITSDNEGTDPGPGSGSGSGPSPSPSPSPSPAPGTDLPPIPGITVLTEAAGAGQVESGRIVIPVNGPVQAPMELLRKWAEQNPSAVVALKAGNVIYSIPLSEMVSGVWRDQLGDQADKAVITIVVTEASKQQSDKAERGAAQIGTNLLMKPVDFEIFAETPSGEKITISKFTGYVSRSFELDFEVEPGNTTGVYLDEATGELLPVPTIFRIVDGKTVAELFRKGNSVYSLISLDKHFVDLEGHWGKSIVETMANKLIVQGTTDLNFDPDKPVTRAEFAALVVRALSMDRIIGNTSFSDVNGEWYEAVVNAAADAGLVGGYPDGTFKPNAPLNRQELAVILKRAAQLVGKPLAITVSSPAAAPFTDYDKAAAWAQQDIADAAAAGIIEGDEQSAFRPEALTTRAEAAAVLKRLLTFAGMYND